MKSLFVTILLPFIVLFSGCVTGTQPMSIGENPLAQIAGIDPKGLFAADRDGGKVAFAKNGLTLLALDSNVERKLSSERPNALAWDWVGTTLAAAFQVAEFETRLELYSHQGELLHEVLLPVALNQMIWSVRGDLLVTGFALKTYSFGGNLRQSLYRVDTEKVTETVLSDTTLKPTTTKRLKPIMQSLQSVVFSSYGDELVFASLHDPPEFSPYLRLYYLNWQVGKKRLLLEKSIQPFQVEWAKSGDSINLRTASGVRELDLWPASNFSSNQSVARNYRFTNGRLYDDQHMLVDWGAGAQLQVLPDGRFLLAVQGSLYLGNGLHAELYEGAQEKSWDLRRWRFEGLINPQEYQELLQKDSR